MTSIYQDPPTIKFIQTASHPEEEVYADSKAPPEGGQPSARVRDETFYFEYTIFEVDNVLFKVPRQEFAANGVFVGLFELPQADSDVEGRDDEHPIKLPGMTAVDFCGFLKALHPMTNEHPAITNRAEWVSCLKLATLWHMDALRRKAVLELDRLTWDPVEKVVVARESSVSRWLIEEYEKLLRRFDPLTVPEANVLGSSTTCLLYAVRERSWNHAASEHRRYGECGYHAVWDQRKRFDFVGEIHKVFRDELTLDEDYKSPV